MLLKEYSYYEIEYIRENITSERQFEYLHNVKIQKDNVESEFCNAEDSDVSGSIKSGHYQKELIDFFKSKWGIQNTRHNKTLDLFIAISNTSVRINGIDIHQMIEEGCTKYKTDSHHVEIRVMSEKNICIN